MKIAAYQGERVSVAAGFPFTYFITRLSRRAQVAWLVILVSVLSLRSAIVATLIMVFAFTLGTYLIPAICWPR